ncbi:glyoxalase family protein [Bacillus pakistanensis]|uniref:Glyoxalase family protein n=1 Tax=Rossellomorea pakistanensis TaxID=992288 RepID=A0ABS2N7I8_9BACI|nr:ring-cleaving dioxygenase [Bacillus pakistanensis]MBM7583818.1 glyoxalase family protein [Bacillus pakistanensis]
MELKGIHHVSALTANAQENFRFYTETLGLRLIKKTVNQDDISVYHLFYGDEKGNPGTELTFFEIPMAAKNHEGVNSISEIALRVKDDSSLSFWKSRFEELGVEHGEITKRFNRKILSFKDFEGQRLSLVSDEHNQGVKAGTPWGKSPIPKEFAIVGLGPIKLTVSYAESTAKILTELMDYRKIGEYPSAINGQSNILVFETGKGGTGSEVHLEERQDLSPERLGRGGVHHVAFRVEDKDEMMKWIDKVKDAKIPNSGFVDRFYFRSLYFREANGILFELATDGPGFDTDEDLEHLGESLALPPFLESRRAEIEAKLKPLNTKKS